MQSLRDASDRRCSLGLCTRNTHVVSLWLQQKRNLHFFTMMVQSPNLLESILQLSLIYLSVRHKKSMLKKMNWSQNAQ